jgi:hypothetical protein
MNGHIVLGLRRRIDHARAMRVTDRDQETGLLDTTPFIDSVSDAQSSNPSDAAAAAGPAAQSDLTMVPTPYSVKSSSSSACWTRPSMMTAPSTPFSTASTHVSILGIMPPRMVPSAM